MRPMKAFSPLICAHCGKPYGHRIKRAGTRVAEFQTVVKPYEPFCTIRCALAYARRMVKQQLTGKDSAQ
jgi:hypothetical protein